MKKFFCAVLLMILLWGGRSDAGVVLALSGGGTRGFAHIGVIEVLEEQGIHVVGIVGTSIGSLVGAMHASGYSAKEMRGIIDRLDLPGLLSENAGPMFVFTGDDRQAKMNTISALTYKKRGKQGGSLGILTGDKLFQFYTQIMRNVDVTNFNELPIPFAAVATDIMTGEKIVMRSGSLPSAMRASMSIPGIFEPWEFDGRLMVDGGLVSNLPVDTAKELFPGFPVIAVDVSDIPSKARPLNTYIDILDQSLTIVMRRTTELEKKHADIVISPNVQEFSFLDDTSAGKIINRGREAALDQLDKINKIAAGTPDSVVKGTPIYTSNIVGDVRVIGLARSMNEQLRKRYLYFVGKPFNVDEVEEAVARLMSAPDVATVDYRMERTQKGDVLLAIDVRRRPDLELGISGYTTNLDPYRWLYLKGTARGVFSELDSLRGVVRLGEQWGFDLSYLAAPEPLNSWELTLAAQKWKMDTNRGYRKWERYAFGGNYNFRVGGVRMGAGAAYEFTDGLHDSNYIGPTFFATQDTLDIPSDPTKGYAWRLNMWWPDFEQVLYRFTYFKPIQVGSMWRTYVRFGYAEGDLDNEGHAVYMGAAEELYSIASRPIEAERMAWVNVAFRRILSRNVLGVVAAEVFGSYGYAMDKNYDKVATPWEVGLAVTIPNNIVNIKLAAMYGSEDFKIGFFLGVPIWDHYPLP